ncbi:hypothetical protein [Cyclobacterium amurskyense]|tara:strand:+ start:175 stop:789 length:615 start_codon:yes stop_codon:yes gene_type:complete
MLCLSFVAPAQTHFYENPDFDQLTAGHEIIAIVPFSASVNLRPKQMKDISTEQLAKMEESEGLSIQSAMYSWFLKREKQNKLKVKVQDTNTTNALLRRNGIFTENLVDYTPEELAQIIGVDAVIMGTFETTKPMSEGASLALGVLVGFYGSTNKAIVNMSIFNAQQGELLINYNKAVSGSMGSSTDDLINVLMRKASRRISYVK